MTAANIHNVQAFASEFFTTAFQSTFKTEHNRDMAMQERMRSPIAFLSEMNGDTMYFHQAMNQDDSADFVEAVVTHIPPVCNQEISIKSHLLQFKLQ